MRPRTLVVLSLILTLPISAALCGAYGYRPAVASYRPPANALFLDTPLARFHYVKEGSGTPVVLLSPDDHTNQSPP
ncbi:hypothetical protein ACTWPT_46205 [Nonomuraea sp. 3N208]|uniref:hypothetical protein n=1 Tax=Nonomuraea sp. 3N208 TaxID=3457421 RepID=UPI003FD14335